MKYTLVTCLSLMVLAALPPVAAAQPADLITVEFAATPLFSESKLLPGDVIDRTATVTNVSSETQEIEFTFDNIIDGDLADVMELAVADDMIVYQFATFDTLFAGGPYALGSLAPGERRAYTFYAAFPPTAGNEYQLTQFEFDLTIGAVGGTQVSDSSSADGDGSSSGGGSHTLQLFNEEVTVVEGTGGAFITWNSNMPASTYVVCSQVNGAGVSLNDESPLFGYSFFLDERFDSNTAHGMVLGGLEPGEYECRPAGRRSASAAYTVGDAVRFTIPDPPAGEVAGVSISLSDLEALMAATMTTDPSQSGIVLGASKGAGGLTYDEFKAEIDQRKAAELVAANLNHSQAAEDARSSSGVAATAEAADYSTPEGVKENLSFSWWPWAMLVIVLLASGFIISRRS